MDCKQSHRRLCDLATFKMERVPSLSSAHPFDMVRKS